MRVAAGIAVAVVVAAAAAAVAGEYSFDGWTPWVAALVVPLAVGEAAAAVAGRRRPWVWLLAATLGSAGLAWGVWLSTSHGLVAWPAGGSVAVVGAAAWPSLRAAAQWRRNDGGDREPVS